MMKTSQWIWGAAFFCIAGLLHADVNVKPVLRQVFERLEENPCLRYYIYNSDRSSIVGVDSSCEGVENSTKIFIAYCKGADVLLPVPPRLRPGRYEMNYTVHFIDGRTQKGSTPFTVVAEENPEAMPVVMWQNGKADLLESIGFTHQLAALTYATHGGKPGDRAGNIRELDENLSHNLRSIDLIKNEAYKPHVKKFARLNRRGVPYARVSIDASDPEFRKEAESDLRRAVKNYGDHPGLTMVLCNSEVRDGSQPAFNGTMEREYRKYTGGESVPQTVTDRKAPPYYQISDFPLFYDIAMDHPMYRFYRWFWQTGDGWNGYHELCRKVYREELGSRADKVIFFHDPAARTPPVPGNAASLEMINQWSYSYFHPIKLATAVDELRAVARLNGNQKLMKTTQAIWYRSPPAPANKKIANPPAWVAQYPDAAYITIAPDHLLEAFWSKISRRLDAIAYHGYGSLVEAVPFKWNQYRFTNEHARDTLRDLIVRVVRPLGPVLKSVPDRPAETAVLCTEANNLFGTAGSWGWGWGTDAEMHQILQRAHLDPEIVFDEDLRNGRWKNLKYLAVPNGTILEAGIVKIITEFQLAGGIVIGDSDLNPLILPDAVVDFKSGKSQEELAKSLIADLGTYYQTRFTADNFDIVTHTRSYKNADYLFAVNDRRKFGDYVGMYGGVRETGVPNSGVLTYTNPQTKVIYDLVARKRLPFTRRGDRCLIPVQFTTCDGRLYLALPQEIARVTAAASIEKDNSVRLDVRIADTQGELVEAILPLEVEILNAKGEKSVGSGYYAVTDGAKTLTVIPSSNDAKGEWRIRVTELASGRSAECNVEVK